jgi:scyllo-inositol 2-dehydrogenase (NADP+)
MIGVGLVGFGLAGRAFHSQVIRAVSGLHLAAIFQRSGDSAAQAYPDVRIVRSYEELLGIAEIRLIVIASPNDTHFEFAKRALAAGRDVLVDKPLTPTLAEAVELVGLAKSADRVLTVYQNRRYDGDFETIRKVVAEGALGRIVTFETHYDRFRPLLKPQAWREKPGPGNGVWFDIGPHLVDHALLLFGEPEAIRADIRMEREHAQADDAFDVSLHYAGGLRAWLRSSILAATPRPRFVVLGTQGSFVKESIDPQENNLRFGKVPAEGPWGMQNEENWGVLTTPRGDGFERRRIPNAAVDYRDFYVNLRDALLGKAKLAVSPEWALSVMRVLELAQESNERGSTVRYTRVCVN